MKNSKLETIILRAVDAYTDWHAERLEFELSQSIENNNIIHRFMDVKHIDRIMYDYHHLTKLIADYANTDYLDNFSDWLDVNITEFLPNFHELPLKQIMQVLCVLDTVELDRRQYTRHYTNDKVARTVWRMIKNERQQFLAIYHGYSLTDITT